MTLFVIKDSWVATGDLIGKESEASLIALARRRGVSQGIPQLRHAEELRVRGLNGRVGLDTILGNRQDHSGHHPQLDRVHTRLVMSPYGKPLHQFSNRTELLLAYHDAIQGEFMP